jgi:hypothetical protein
MAQRLRIFVAHPKGTPDEALDLTRREIEEVARRQLPQHEIEIVLGRDDFQRSFARFGGWDGWIASVAAGTEYREGMIRPRFDVIVTTTATLGRASAQMLRIAGGKAKPVLFFSGDDFIPVQNIVQRDGQDYRSGWEIVTPRRAVS